MGEGLVVFPSGDVRCEPCPPGTYSDEFGTAGCKPCNDVFPNTSTGSSGAASIDACGVFQSAINSHTCVLKFNEKGT